MVTLFEKLIIGHLVGDYLLQPKAMATNKTKHSINGFLWCLSHSLVYTACIAVATGATGIITIFLIFLSHFLIDRWSLGEWWLKLIHGRSLRVAFESKEKFREFDIAFSAIVYTVVDNTIHLVLMILIFRI